MSFTLRVDEVLDAMVRMQHPRFELHKKVIEAAVTAAAADLGAAIEAVSGEARFELDIESRLYVSLYPTAPDQPLPSCLDGLDNEEEWDADAAPDSDWAKRSGWSTTAGLVEAESDEFCITRLKDDIIVLKRKADGAMLRFKGRATALVTDRLWRAQSASALGRSSLAPATVVGQCLEGLMVDGATSEISL